MLVEELEDSKWLQRIVNIISLLCKFEKDCFMKFFTLTLFPTLMLYLNNDLNEAKCSFAISVFGIIITEGKMFDYLTNLGDLLNIV